MNLRRLVGTLALAAVAVVPVAAGAQTTYHHHWARQTSAVISGVDSKTSIHLNNGRHVFLAQGTVINPTGTTLQVGQRIAVYGAPGGNGAINAHEIDVLGWANHPHHM
jgi:Domain of unknown function (DUF5666)